MSLQAYREKENNPTQFCYQELLVELLLSVVIALTYITFCVEGKLKP